MKKKDKNKDKDKNMGDDMGMKLRGELEITAYKKGKIIHHEKQSNIVTKWAKHATMHLLTGEAFSTHGKRTIDGYTSISRRSSDSNDHVENSVNNDGTLISNERYFSDNSKYDKYWIQADNLSPSGTEGDVIGGEFIYPFFPTKMLFGTGVEYSSWDEVVAAGRDGVGQDGYANAGNGGWNSSLFNEKLTENIELSNYYSEKWDESNLKLTKTRTVNDIYSGSLDNTVNELTEESFGVRGAIKNGTYTNSSQSDKLTDTNGDGKLLLSGSYRGIGLPAFIYATRDTRFMQGGSVSLSLGTTTATKSLESKITFTVKMPEQPNGEFYPYNGYLLKVAGLFADSAMLLDNTVPPDSNDGNDDELGKELVNYKKMPDGLMWATRNIAPIRKNHDISITAQWTIYL